MVKFSAGELSQWVSRLWKNGIPEGPITGVTQDTRSIKPGNLYVAIKGERFDGHDFLQQAFEKGAAGALVSEHVAWKNNPVLSVPDPVKGMQALAHGYRKKWIGTVVGITGSVGKTTVKEMCAAVLSMKGMTHATAGNYNNHIGLPLSMLAMPQEARSGIFEIGMNHVGEIGPLSYLLQPKVGILTDVGNVHREHFNSVDEIAHEKARLVEQVPSSGIVILDRDSHWYTQMRSKVCANVVTLSLGGMADYVGRPVAPGVMEVNGYTYIMPLPGEHIMRNALRAIALGLELGMEPAEVVEGLRRFKLPPMRWERSCVNDVHVINDAYNASLLSMQAVLRTFAGLTGFGKRWIVVGGMRELGDTTDEEHAELGHFIDRLPVDGVITVGELGRKIKCHAKRPFFQCAAPAEAALILRNNLSAGDAFVLKASRGEQLEQVLQRFKEI